jgi:hypothetical protein
MTQCYHLSSIMVLSLLKYFRTMIKELETFMPIIDCHVHLNKYDKIRSQVKKFKVEGRCEQAFYLANH